MTDVIIIGFVGSSDVDRLFKFKPAVQVSLLLSCMDTYFSRQFWYLMQLRTFQIPTQNGQCIHFNILCN